MEQAVAVRTDLDPNWYPKHIVYLKSRIKELQEVEDDLRKNIKAEDYPYYELWATIEAKFDFMHQLHYELNHWDGDPEADPYIPF